MTLPDMEEGNTIDKTPPNVCLNLYVVSLNMTLDAERAECHSLLTYSPTHSLTLRTEGYWKYLINIFKGMYSTSNINDIF